MLGGFPIGKGFDSFGRRFPDRETGRSTDGNQWGKNGASIPAEMNMELVKLSSWVSARKAQKGMSSTPTGSNTSSGLRVNVSRKSATLDAWVEARKIYVGSPRIASSQCLT